MPDSRGAIPLALLVAGALAAGIVAVAARIGPEEERPQAQPRPASPSPEPEPSPSPSPVAQEPSETLETPEAETQPTAEPSPTAPETPAVDSTPLARTGGPTLPLYVGGLVLIAGSVLVWRFSRSPNQPAPS